MIAPEHRRILGDVVAPRTARVTNHTSTIGPKNVPDPGGPVPLDREQSEQDHDRDRDHVGSEHRCRDLQTLDRAEHRDRRRDHAVAVQERRAEQPGDHKPLPAPLASPLGGATKAVRAMIPPSPLLSARMTKPRYLTEMTRIRDQKISDRMPSTLAGVPAIPCEPCSDSRSA